MATSRKKAKLEKMLSVRVDEDLHERARIHGIRAKRSLKAIVAEALAEYLKKRGA